MAALIGALASCVIGFALSWPLGGLELAIGWVVPFVIVAGGARGLWAAYMLGTLIVMYLIATIASD
jgi:hypothetical protein